MRVRNALLRGPLGFGAPSLGNMFRNIPDTEASATVPNSLSYITKIELSEDGRVRHLATLNVEAIVEKLEEFDNTARSYSYSIIQAPFAVTGYLSTLQVKPAADGKGSRAEWTAFFTSNTGVSDEQASKIFQEIFEEGLKELASRFKSGNETRRHGDLKPMSRDLHSGRCGDKR